MSSRLEKLQARLAALDVEVFEHPHPDSAAFLRLCDQRDAVGRLVLREAERIESEARKLRLQGRYGEVW